MTGCLSERYKDELQEGIPEVDAWFGTRDLPRLLKTLRADYKQLVEAVARAATTLPQNRRRLRTPVCVLRHPLDAWQARLNAHGPRRWPNRCGQRLTRVDSHADLILRPRPLQRAQTRGIGRSVE